MGAGPALAKSPQSAYLILEPATVRPAFPENSLMDPAISSLIDRAGLDKSKVRQLIGRGLEGAGHGVKGADAEKAEKKAKANN